MTTTPTPASGAAIQRYKIGYHADEWGQRSSTPSGIPDASGSWVRYADHVTALAAGQATAAQAVAEQADTVVLNAAMRAIQQAIELIGAPTDERMRAVRRVLRGAVVVAEDSGDIPAQPDCLTCSGHGAVGNSGFDYKTAADFLSGKTVSDEALRKFVAASRGAHDARAALHAKMLSLQGELASREAEIALLKRSLLDAEAAPTQGATEMEHLQRTAVGWQGRALRAERNWAVCRRWAIAGGAPVEKLGDDPDPPFHAAPAAPAQPAAQQGVAYAALPEPYCNAHDDADACYPDMFSEHQMHAFADATHALRTEQPAPADRIDLHQALTDPENQPNQYGVEFGMSGTHMHFKVGNQLFKLAYEPDEQEEFDFMKRMLVNAFTAFTHDVKTAPQPSPTAQAAESAQEDAALWHWLAEYLVGTRTDLDDEIVASETVNDLRKLVEAATKQGEKQ